MDGAWPRDRSTPERFRSRLRALVHVRQFRASPSVDRAKLLNAAADSFFPQAEQILVAIMFLELLLHETKAEGRIL